MSDSPSSVNSRLSFFSFSRDETHDNKINSTICIEDKLNQDMKHKFSSNIDVTKDLESTSEKNAFLRSKTSSNITPPSSKRSSDGDIFESHNSTRAVDVKKDVYDDDDTDFLNIDLTEFFTPSKDKDEDYLQTPSSLQSNPDINFNETSPIIELRRLSSGSNSMYSSGSDDSLSLRHGFNRLENIKNSQWQNMSSIDDGILKNANVSSKPSLKLRSTSFTQSINSLENSSSNRSSSSTSPTKESFALSLFSLPNNNKLDIKSFATSSTEKDIIDNSLPKNKGKFSFTTNPNSLDKNLLCQPTENNFFLNFTSTDRQSSTFSNQKSKEKLPCVNPISPNLSAYLKSGKDTSPHITVEDKNTINDSIDFLNSSSSSLSQYMSDSKLSLPVTAKQPKFFPNTSSAFSSSLSQSSLTSSAPAPSTINLGSLFHNHNDATSYEVPCSSSNKVSSETCTSAYKSVGTNIPVSHGNSNNSRSYNFAKDFDYFTTNNKKNSALPRNVNFNNNNNNNNQLKTVNETSSYSCFASGFKNSNSTAEKVAGNGNSMALSRVTNDLNALDLDSKMNNYNLGNFYNREIPNFNKTNTNIAPISYNDGQRNNYCNLDGMKTYNLDRSIVPYNTNNYISGYVPGSNPTAASFTANKYLPANCHYGNSCKKTQNGFKKSKYGQGKSGHSNKHKLKQELYKTELCRSSTAWNCCPYNSKCQFAHSLEELRPSRKDPKYRTKVCAKWRIAGKRCPYGSRCSFAHPDEMFKSLYLLIWQTGGAPLYDMKSISAAANIRRMIDDLVFNIQRIDGDLNGCLLNAPESERASILERFGTRRQLIWQSFEQLEIIASDILVFDRNSCAAKSNTITI